MTLSSSRAFRPPEIPNTRRRNGKYPCLLDVHCVAGVERGKGKAGMAFGMTLSSPRASRPPEISFPSFLNARNSGYYTYTSSAALSQVIDAST